MTLEIVDMAKQFAAAGIPPGDVVESLGVLIKAAKELTDEGVKGPDLDRRLEAVTQGEEFRAAQRTVQLRHSF